jgi:hypothetical protein
MTTTVSQTSTAIRYAIPALCCTAGNQANHGDLNQSWTCKRSEAINHARQWAESIDAERERAAHLRGRNVERRAANLRNWADDQEARLARLGAWWDARECAGTGYVPTVYCGGYTL